MTNQIATVASLPRNDKFCYEYCAAKYNNLIHRVITNKRGRSNPIKLCDFDASLAMTKQIETVTSFPRNCTCHYELCEAKRSNLLKKCAFTLAEVLITLGIIGIVAAIIMPTVVSNYRKQIIETRLKKFYSTFNNAITMAENDYGNISEWNFPTFMNYSFFQTYILPYWNLSTYKKSYTLESVGNYAVAFNISFGGSMGCTRFGGGTGIASDGGKFLCLYLPLKDAKFIVDKEKYEKLINGKDYFVFYLEPTGVKPNGRGVKPAQNSSLGTAYKGCRSTTGVRLLYYRECAKQIMENNWKFPKNYPVKI